MPRTIVVRKGTDIQGLRAELLDARYTGARGDAAVAQLKALNPHLDLGKVEADTVLFVPDAPGFRASASASPPGGSLDAFQAFVADALAATTARQKAARDTRVTTRAQLGAALKSPAVKRAAEADPALAPRIEAARKSITEEEASDKQVEEAVAAIGKAALAALADMKKRLA